MYNLRLQLVFMIIFIVTLFNVGYSYHWEKFGDDYYVQEDDVAICKTNVLINEGGFVYYFDEDGKMCKGWFVNTETNKVYFFDNNPNGEHYGQMVFGLKTIDGYKRYFDESGALVKTDKEGDYVKAYGDYWADYKGNLYFNNELQFDQNNARSDYYTDLNFYKNTYLNNSNINKDNIVTWETILQEKIDREANGPKIN